MVRSREQAAKSALSSSRNAPGTCQLWTRERFGAPSAGDVDRDGDADAVDGWKKEPKDKRHPGDRHPPRGVPVAWSGGSHGHGHRAISLGHGKIRSTDARGSGRVATVDLDWPEKHWGLHYLGWSETIDGNEIPLSEKKAKPKPKPKPKPESKPKPKPEPEPDPEVGPAKKGHHFNFRVHLVPGNKAQTMTSVIQDMRRINAKSHRSAIVFNTERSAYNQRLAIDRGLSNGYTVVFNNENPIAYGPSWKELGNHDELLLAKQDPHMEDVSPNRYLNTVPLEDEYYKGVTVLMKGTHLLSEANCIHVHVRGRPWREKMWPVQLSDVLDSCERDHKSGFPIVLAGDFNTGVHFNGSRLFELFKKRFGEDAVHVHNGALDHVILISTKDVKLSEVGKEFVANNTSDHDSITAMIRVELIH
jgi:hypothetical protein